MTIASQTSRISYTGDGSTTAFAVPFYFAANADLVVSLQDLSGSVATEILGTHYSLTGATVSTGGTCTFTVAPTTGYIIAITRVPQITQTTSYNNNDPFPAKSHELALDKTATIDQYLKSLIDRAILVAPTDTPPMSTLPPASVRALKNLSFDSLGNPSVSTPVTGTAVSSAMIPVVSASTLTIARGLLGIADAITTRTAMKALDTTKTTAAYLTEAGREGEFVFRAGNYAAQVTADTQEGIYLKADAISTSVGAWVRVVPGTLFVATWFGVKGDGSTDDTAAMQAAITAGSVVVPPSATNYVLSADILVPSNRHFWVQKGATIINTGGRFTAFLPGGGNVHFQIDGVIGFLATTTAPDIGDWPTGHRGLIEMGGTHASPGTNFRVTSNGGRVYSDYVWAGIPGTSFTAAMLNRKGITFINAAHCSCRSLEVDHIYGEAVYFNGYDNHYDIKFLNNYVHDCAFNGLNFNTSLSYQGLLAQGNHIERVMQGIELSGGTADNNYIETCNKGIIFGGGAGVTGVRVTDNTVVSASTVAYDLEFSPTTPVLMVHVSGNEAISSGTTAFIINSVRGGQFKENTSYNHASIAAGVAFNIASDCAGVHCDGNLTKSAGAFSTGNFANNAGAANTIGTNPNYA